MVHVVILRKGKEISYYMDERWKRALDNSIIPRVTKRDKDAVLIYDGGEGSGKSTKGFQDASYLDYQIRLLLKKPLEEIFDLKDICFSPDEFIKRVNNAKQGDVIVYDEAYTGLSSRGTLSEINNLLVSMMMEMRQKNLIIIVILPTFFMLDKYVAIFRARGLVHIYEKKDRMGFWRFYNKKKKKLLYLKGKKEFSYKDPKTNFKGRFLKGYIIDEEVYRKRKSIALKSRERRTKSEKYIEQRNRLIYSLHKEFGYSLVDVEELCNKYGIKLKKSVISEIIARFKERGISLEENE